MKFALPTSRGTHSHVGAFLSGMQSVTLFPQIEVTNLRDRVNSLGNSERFTRDWEALGRDMRLTLNRLGKDVQG